MRARVEGGGVGAVLGYAVAGGAAVLAGVALLSAVVGPGARAAVWVGAVIAYALQVVAFAVLVWSRGGPRFLGAWVGGTVARFAVVLVTALWLGRMPQYPVGPLLLSLVGFLFVLLMLEAVFFRMGMRSR